MEYLFLAICFLPSLVTALIAWGARNSGRGVRYVFAGVSILTGVYALIATGFALSGHAENFTFLPFVMVALTCWCAVTGLCAVALLQYGAKGQLYTPGAIAATALICGSLLAGILFLFPFLKFPFTVVD